MSFWSKVFGGVTVIEDPESVEVKERIKDAQITLGQVCGLVIENQRELDRIRGDVAYLQVETARLEQLPTTKKLRARIEGLEKTRRWMSQQLQDAHRRAEDELYERKMEREGRVTGKTYL